MDYTTNLNLKKPNGEVDGDFVLIEDLNSNFDAIDTAVGDHVADTDIHVTAGKQDAWDALKTFQTAGGTGTAITLTGVELVNGFQTTFVILASNSGAATSINGKPLYKPGTTTAPKLIAGKAATVWYNAAGGCFFIKASAEGTAVAGDVLASKTFSNDNDTGLTGTMTNRGAVTITPGTENQTITSGYHNGSGYVVGDADLVSSNIKSGINIFGVSGNLGNIKSIQRGIATWANTLTQQDITISTITTGASVAIIEQIPGGNADYILTVADITSATNLRLTRNTGVNLYDYPVYWTVIEFDNVKSKQTGLSSIETSSKLVDTTVNVSIINMSKSILFCNHKTSFADSGGDAYRISSRIKTSTAIELFSNVSFVHSARWQLIEFN